MSPAGKGKKSKREAEALAVAEGLKAINQHLRKEAFAAAAALPTPLTPQQMLALRVLVRHDREHPDAPGMALGELAAGMGSGHSTVSGIVDRLERAGIVTRAVRQDDRRYARIELAPEVLPFVKNELPARRAGPLAAVAEKAKEGEWADVVRGVTVLKRLLNIE
ncbi:MAG TPA: MarR family transcriptional regulator [Actinomycetota bacterium]|nr:MarR family transcriptional regulator [Actinomycetota bacterium]